MAYELNSASSQRIDVGDGDALTLANAGWTISILAYYESSTPNYRYIMGWGGWQAAPSINVYEENGRYRGWIEDDAGVNTGEATFWSPLTHNDVWHRLTLVWDGTDLIFYRDGDTQENSITVAFTGDWNVADDFIIGCRGDRNAARYADMSFAEFATWKRVLSAGELAGLTQKRSAQEYRPDVFVNGINNLVETRAGLSVTAIGSPGFYDHPPIQFRRQGWLPTVIPSGGINISVPVSSITVSGQAPGVAAGASVTVPLDALSVTGLVPSIATGSAVTVPLATMTVSGLVPTLDVGANINVEVPLAALGITGLVPEVETGVTVTVPLSTVVMNGLIPEIAAGEAAIWQPVSDASGVWVEATDASGTWLPQ